MRRLFFAFAILFLLTPLRASAETTVGGHVACLSKDFFDQATTAFVQKDTAALSYLEKQGVCIVLKAGLQASILERGWTGWVKARIYVGDSAAVVWGPMEAFKS